MKRFFKYIPIALLATLLGACTDQKLWDDDEVIGEGESTISADFTFKTYGSALDSRTGGTELDALTSLTVLAYSQDGNTLIARQAFSVADGNLTVEYTNTQPPQGAVAPEFPKDNGTGKGTFKLNLPYGRYKIYAVANADISSYSNDDLSTDAKLKDIQFTWNNDVTKDGQMFGWFTTNTPTAVSAEKFDADVVAVNRPNVALSAWLVRLASKVTVDFDASGLKDNVFVYLKSVQIKDIPKECYLGKSNTPAEDEIDPNGEIIYYYNRDKYPDGPSSGDYNINNQDIPYLTNGNPTFGSDHSHEADALFFYENNQGTGKDKAQDIDKNGTIDFPDGNNGIAGQGFKDEVRAGSYIEVKAYYISRNTERAGQGEIIYRFMLGKDHIKDYNAQRNYHFKLTLMLKGFANEADWHIVYDQEEHEIIAPNPYYISYLYNHSMMLPLTIKTGKETISKIDAEIVSNNWAPLNASGGATKLPGYAYYELYWAVVDQPAIYLWNGFLSLRKTEKTDVEAPSDMTDWTVNSNKAYYESSNRGNQSYSGTDLQPSSMSVTEALEKGLLHVQVSQDKNNNHTYVVNMPLWTRAKTLISQTAYTGNNPYVAYRRQAKVNVKVTLSNNEVMSTDKEEYYHSGENVEIQQVRRVVNPKGIWRAGNENNDFDVDLMVLPDEESTDFKSLTSDGPWRAYVFRDTKRGTGNLTGWDDANGTIRLVGGTETTTGTTKVSDRDGIEREYQTIEGKTGSKMQFKVKFNGTTSDDNPNYAIIRVEYQNYSCYHLIFVRQGYGADDIDDSGNKWLTKNNVAQNQVTASPLDEGSMFKFGNWSQPIAATNNKNGKSPWIRVTPHDFKLNTAGTKELELYGGGSAQWTGITSVDTRYGGNFAEQTNMRVATEADFNNLRNNPDIEKGFGVLYGGKSSKCLIGLDDVYGYDASNTNRGMRGCFVYNYKTGKNLFFPIGASGYGHRKHKISFWGDDYLGVLRYSCASRWGYFDATANDKGQGYVDGVDGAPLFFDIFRRPGALYWLNGGGANPSWDINYFSFDFGSIPATNVDYGKDAMFVRSIAK